MHGLHHKHERRGKTHGDLHDWSHSMVQNKAVSKQEDDGVQTVLSVVYVTMSATFTGATAGYTTITGGSTKPATSTIDSKTTQPATSATSIKSSPSSTSAASNQNAQASVSSVSTPAASSKNTNSATSTIPNATSSHTTLQTSSSAVNNAFAGTPIAATRTASTSSSTPTPSQTSAATSGMTNGAKAGMAIGILLGLGLLAALLIFVLRRKTQQKEEGKHQKLDDEKSATAFATSGGTTNPAPRLSLRPVTQFMGIGGESKVAEMTNATGGLNVKNSSAWERRPSTSNSHDSANPFGDSAAAEKAAEQNAINAPIPVSMPAADPFADKHSQRSISPIDSNCSEPQSPPAARVGSAVPIAQNANSKGANNVHRVHLDFKPSMEDELELRAGDVVRILHEYDDGWVSRIVPTSKHQC